MITSLKLRHVKDSFHRKLTEDIKRSPNVFAFADKTNNIYEMSKDHHHHKLLHDNITKTYQKAIQKLEAPINLEAKSISTQLKISNRVKSIARTPAFVTLKDHKDNFHSNPTCRLINPSKNKLGKVSKQLLEKINSDFVEKLQFNQLGHTNTALKWLNNITDKGNCSFIQFYIKQFFLSITKNILHQTLKSANIQT